MNSNSVTTTAVSDSIIPTTHLYRSSIQTASASIKRSRPQVFDALLPSIRFRRHASPPSYHAHSISVYVPSSTSTSFQGPTSLAFPTTRKCHAHILTNSGHTSSSESSTLRVASLHEVEFQPVSATSTNAFSLPDHSPIWNTPYPPSSSFREPHPLLEKIQDRKHSRPPRPSTGSGYPWHKQYPTDLAPLPFKPGTTHPI